MKKAIISFDMPSACADCPFCFKSDKIGTGEKYTYKQLYRCSMCPSYIINIYLPDIVATKPEWCPLKELPERKSMRDLCQYDTDNHYEQGWNACLDAIKRGE